MLYSCTHMATVGVRGLIFNTLAICHSFVGRYYYQISLCRTMSLLNTIPWIISTVKDITTIRHDKTVCKKFCALVNLHKSVFVNVLPLLTKSTLSRRIIIWPIMVDYNAVMLQMLKKSLIYIHRIHIQLTTAVVKLRYTGAHIHQREESSG